MSNTESNFFVSHFTDEEFHKETVVDRWPLHLTVVPPFEIPENHRRLSQVTSLLGAIGRELGPIKLQYGNIRPGSIPLEIGNEALYGPDNDIQVVEIIDPSGKLKELHKQLVVSLGHIGCTFTDLNPQWSMDNYSPHATTKSGKKLDRPFFCDTIALNKKVNGTKRILTSFDLAEPQD